MNRRGLVPTILGAVTADRHCLLALEGVVAPAWQVCPHRHTLTSLVVQLTLGLKMEAFGALVVPPPDPYDKLRK